MSDLYKLRQDIRIARNTAESKRDDMQWKRIKYDHDTYIGLKKEVEVYDKVVSMIKLKQKDI